VFGDLAIKIIHVTDVIAVIFAWRGALKEISVGPPASSWCRACGSDRPVKDLSGSGRIICVVHLVFGS
jgi:hypothetical protein